MNFKPIVIVSGEPYGIFNEIFLKVINKYSSKRPLILIGSKMNLLKEAKKNKKKIKLNLLNKIEFNIKKIDNKKISKPFIQNKSLFLIKDNAIIKLN